MESKQRYTLGKTERLKSRKLIEQLFKEGKSFSVQPIRVYWMLSPPNSNTSYLQFGVAAGTKHFKHAVDRNRIKRLIREAYRLQKIELQLKLKDANLHLNVFFIFTGKEVPDYKLVFEKTGIALQKLSEICVQSTSA